MNNYVFSCKKTNIFHKNELYVAIYLFNVLLYIYTSNQNSIIKNWKHNLILYLTFYKKNIQLSSKLTNIFTAGLTTYKIENIGEEYYEII